MIFYSGFKFTMDFAQALVYKGFSGFLKLLMFYVQDQAPACHGANYGREVSRQRRLSV